MADDDPSEENGQRLDEVHPSSFDSLDISLEEARRRYDQEESRAESLEVKIGGLLAINSIILGIISSVDSIPAYWLVILLGTGIVAIFFTLKALKTREYKRPIRGAYGISAYPDRSKKEARYKLLSHYMSSTNNNEKVNDTRYSQFIKGFKLSGALLVLLVLTPIVEILVQTVTNYCT